MSAQHVFNELLSYYQATGEVMKEDRFAAVVAPDYNLVDLMAGIQIFNAFLDSHRKEVG